jgi:hypothetical protein
MSTTSILSRRSIMTAVATIGAAAAVPALAEQASVEATPLKLAVNTIDRAGMVARAEQMVDFLGSRYIREGWQESFDRQRAAAFLESVRRFDPSAEDCEHFETMRDWMHDHGQSFDWVLDGDPSGMIGTGAKASPRVAEADPIFPAIERWKEALAFSDGTFADPVEEEAALAKESAAADIIFKTVPTTPAGIRAKIDFAFSVNHVTNHLKSEISDVPLRTFLDTLYEAARTLAGEA